MYIQIIFEAILLALTLSILVGPVFFALIQTSIRRGVKVGIFFAIGIFLSDFTCILLTNLGISQLVSNSKYSTAIGVGGGILLILFGLFEIIHKEKHHVETDDDNAPIQQKDQKLFTNLVKAYFMNILTPSVFFFWIFWAGIVNAKYKGGQVIVFFLITLLTVLATDTFKVYLATQLKKIMTDHVLLIVRRTAGVVLMIFGVYLILKSLCYVP